MIFDKEYKMPLKDRIDLFLKMKKPFGLIFSFKTAFGKLTYWNVKKKN